MKRVLIIFISLLLFGATNAQQDPIEKAFRNPPASAKPWVIWYWLHGAVSKQGITTDLEAMKEVGIGGAYLMTIKDTSSAIPFQPQVRQLTPEWWNMVHFALKEAKRLKIEIGVHVSDGFALAGGPWITPEMSMQQLTWSKTIVTRSSASTIFLPEPQKKENYYKDIAVYAYPVSYTAQLPEPSITASNGMDASFLAKPETKQIFRSDSNCWIQYSYPSAVTIRQVKIKKQTNAYQSQRFVIQKSEDGVNFVPVDTLQPPRHGWQDWDEPYTHAVETFSAKYIRLVWQREGTEPGSEDLDAAKWKPALRVQGIFLSSEPVINHYEAKNGSTWRVAPSTTIAEVNKTDAVPINKIINLSSKLAADGKLNWAPPAGADWMIVRIGHTSTGYRNTTGGGGKGLECDKLNASAAKLQFENWFEKFYTQTDPVLAKEVIKVFHMDSWECGSQNWTKNFPDDFKKRRGYDLLPYLLVMTGVPVKDAATSEKILQDVRQTIAELVNDKFYLTLKNLAHAKGVQFSAESIAPTFVSDGLMHYKHADIPMGEFWVNSPTHDKPNDMLDAISGGHIYGKNIIAAEAFTTLRSDWSEHPGNLKALGDRAFAAGINKLALHVFMHNPDPLKKPGMTLDGIGLFYQPNQTWFKQSKAWIEYLTRCQALLQLGKPVVDIGVFTGEEIPRRSLLPDRLMNVLPGLFGEEKVQAEKRRLLNNGQPQRELPAGVTHSANMADPENYIDPLNGYSYDCFNPEVLMQMQVKKGKVVTPGGASYKVLVIPGKHPMNPDAKMSEPVKRKLNQLAEGGAKIILDTAYGKRKNPGKKIHYGPFAAASLENLGIQPAISFTGSDQAIAWTCRVIEGTPVYFLSNQTGKEISTSIRFPFSYNDIQIWKPAASYFLDMPQSIQTETSGIKAVFQFAPGESYFVVLKNNPEEWAERYPINLTHELSRPWLVRFSANGTTIPDTVMQQLRSWTESGNSSVRYFSGTVSYTNTFIADEEWIGRGIKLIFDEVHDIATIKVNGKECGTVWTAPYEWYISDAVKTGENRIEIEVTNTWRNKLIFDELNPQSRTTWFNSPYKLKDKPLLPAGLVGPVKLFIR